VFIYKLLTDKSSIYIMYFPRNFLVLCIFAVNSLLIYIYDTQSYSSGESLQSSSPNFRKLVNLSEPNNHFAQYGLSYCDEVAEYQKRNEVVFDRRGLPTKEHRKVFTSYSKGKLVGDALWNNTNVVTDWGASRSNRPPISPSADMFFIKREFWYKRRTIGKDFLCEGQRFNHIIGNNYIGGKKHTVAQIQKYAKYYKGREHCFDPWKVMPYTLDMTDKNQCKEFLEILKSQNTFEGINWMIKLGGNIHNGKGVSPVDQDLANKLLNKTCPFKYDYLAQRYIKNPMLIHNRKFDFRTYLVIANMDPLIVLYHDGFIRMSMNEYDLNSNDKSTHLTNLKVAQKTMDTRNFTKSEQEMLLKDQSWSYTHLHNYLMNLGLVGEDWLDNYLRKKLKENMFHIVRMNLDKLMKHPQVFELFGLDFLLDTDLNLWYIEANLTPSISGTSDEKRELNTKLISDLVDIEYALMYKADLDNILEDTNFEVVFDERQEGMKQYAGLISEECV